MNQNPLILIEFNELSPPLMHRFMSEGRLPHFKRFYDEAKIYTTDAGEDPPNLNPWIQWVTVHSGLPFSEHGIFHLGEAHKLKQKCLWDLLSDAGLRVWVCGSMNLRYDLPLNGALLPDPWTTEISPHPSDLLPYFQFVRHNVQEHTNEELFLSASDYLRFLAFMVTHGLSSWTLSSIVKELIRERVTNQCWKRAVILDKLQWDMFRWYHKRLKPHFSTFFSNSTAHLQHKYWRNMEPEHFKIKPTVKEQAEFEKAILFGYQEMDKLMGRFMELAGDHATLIFCTALSQQACLVYDEEGGKSFYRPRKFEELFVFADVTGPVSISPVMSEQFHLRFDSEQDASVAEERLRSLEVEGRPAMLVKRKGAAVFSGCSLFHQLSRDALLTHGLLKKSTRFFDLFYQAESIKSGMHHRDGLLWIRSKDLIHAICQEKVSLCSIAPTILEMLGVPRPHYMKASPLA